MKLRGFLLFVSQLILMAYMYLAFFHGNRFSLGDIAIEIAVVGMAIITSKAVEE